MTKILNFELISNFELESLIFIIITMKKENKKIKKEEIFRITPEMNIMEAVEIFPEIAQVFVEKGLPCLGCAASRFEKISDIAEEFGMKAEDLIKEMETKIEKQKLK